MTGQSQFIIATPDDFDFPATLSGMSEDVLYQVEDGSLFRSLLVGKDLVLFRLAPGKDGNIVGTILSDTGDRHIEYLIDFSRRWFDLDRDLSSFYQISDPLLTPLLSKYRGWRMVGIPDLFEALSWAVIGQQVNLTFAHKVKRAFTEQFGESISYQNNTHHIFPNPEVVAQLNPDKLLPLQFSRRKAEYIIGIASEIVDGHLSRTMLEKMTFEDQRDTLVAIRGIGQWTANYAMMKTLRQANALPAGDAGLQNALKNYLGLSAKPSVEEIEKMAQNWEGWAAYVTLYFWRSLNDD